MRSEQGDDQVDEIFLDGRNQGDMPSAEKSVNPD
jgi:hypothetical protein